MHSKLKIFGVSGTNGAGKDLLGAVLTERHGIWFISVTELLRDECRRRGLPVERENLREISAEWRRKFGLGVLVDKAIEAFEALPDKTKYKGVIMASLRNPAEADRLHELGGTMVWVDAEPRTRYDRIQANAASRGRAEEDTKTFEQFLAEEHAEMYAPAGADAAALHNAGVKERSDIFLQNNSADIATFELDAVKALDLD